MNDSLELRCATYNAVHRTDYTPESYDEARRRDPRVRNWDDGWDACEQSLAAMDGEKASSLPEPTEKQAACDHAKWIAMNPQPRHCLECGLLMWDAGD